MGLSIDIFKVHIKMNMHTVPQKIFTIIGFYKFINEEPSSEQLYSASFRTEVMAIVQAYFVIYCKCT